MNTHFAIAIHALTLLAYADGQPLTSTQMAGSINTNPVFLQRILRSLREAGLIETQRGANGGNTLLRSSEAITLLEVYRAVTPEKLFKIHTEPNPNCPVGANIEPALALIFGEAEQTAEQTLAGYTLADALRGVTEAGQAQAKAKIAKLTQ